jgi:glutaredoxin
VREVLSELDITYELRSAGKGSAQRQELEKITGGSTQCPFLIDPNTNTNMPESKAIIEYLYKNYAKFTPPSELLGSVSQVITPLLKPIYKVIAPLQAGSNREDMAEYENEIAATKAGIEKEITSNKVVVYSYSLSPFCTEAIAVLDSLDIEYENISLGLEWIPFLINEGGSQKRAALGALTGQTSLPHVFVAGKSIGGLYEGLIPALEDGSFFDIYQSENDSK